jgi:hypothetical protein
MIWYLLHGPPRKRGGFGPARLKSMTEDRIMAVAAAVFVTASVLLTLSLL